MILRTLTQYHNSILETLMVLKAKELLILFIIVGIIVTVASIAVSTFILNGKVAELHTAIEYINQTIPR